MSVTIRRLTRFGTAVALLVASTLFLAGRPAAADPIPGKVKLFMPYDNKCLEADLNNINSNGDAAQMWSCWNDPGNQKWRLMQIDGIYGTSGIYKIVNDDSGKCLEGNLNYRGNGTPVQLWQCYEDPGNQQWRVVGLPPTIYQPLSEVKFVNMYTGQCLDADLGNINNNGARLQLWDCWNDPGNERFTEQYAGPA